MKDENLVIDAVGGYEGFEQLLKRGKQLHDQAVFELFAQLLSNAILSLRKWGDNLIRVRVTKGQNLVMNIKQQNPA